MADTFTTTNSPLDKYLDDPQEMVELSRIDPRIIIECKWATPNNMLGRAAYADNCCFLRRAAAERLSRVQSHLYEKGMGLKIWEGYRPLWMQQLLWNEIGDHDLVSNPAHGRRTHIRGIAADVTLVQKKGDELKMPTAYCEFSKRDQMRHSWTDLSEEIIQNRLTLREAMEAQGFEIYEDEWWHYNLPNWQDFPLLDDRELVKPAPVDFSASRLRPSSTPQI